MSIKNMDFKHLFDDDRAVSPVIGVILMVAITVILAAVIGTFVLGLSDQVQQTTPRASFGFETADNKQNVTITHQSGDTISADSLVVKATSEYTFSRTSGNMTSSTWKNITGNSDVSAGSSVSIAYGNYTNNDGGSNWGGETIRVVYNSPDSDNTATLAKFEVPS